jgi:hypothetical protein
MGETKKAPYAFRFSTRAPLTILTGYRARNISELLFGVQKQPLSVIYYHTHRFLQQHQFLSPEPPNDFAFWITNTLKETELGERIASIDTVRFTHLSELRENFIRIIEEHIRTHPPSRAVSESEAFHFMNSVSFVIPTRYEAWDLIQFYDALKMISIHSIYFHVFEAKLRLEKGTNDFSLWLNDHLQESEIAAGIERLDPYTHTLEGLREQILGLIRKRHDR